LKPQITYKRLINERVVYTYERDELSLKSRSPMQVPWQGHRQRRLSLKYTVYLTSRPQTTVAFIYVELSFLFACLLSHHAKMARQMFAKVKKV